jgi:apolipoprotein N-acyltransferase
MLKQLHNFSKAYNYVPIVISAVLVSLSLIFVNHIIAWFALSFLFLSLFNTTRAKQAIYKGLVFGGVSAGILNYWMVPSIMQYAQSSMWLAVFCWLLSTFIIGFVYAIQFLFFVKTRFSGATLHALVGNAFLMASAWIIMEWVRAVLFAGMPWMSYSLGISQASNLFMAQPAALGGVYILAFLLVIVNYSFAYAIHTNLRKQLLVPVLLITAHFIVGVVMYSSISDKLSASDNPKVSAALVLASLPPETIWDENNGNALVQNLLSLNKQAVASGTDFILWSETVIPWSYSIEDAFLKEISRITATTDTHFMLGMSTAVSSGNNAIYNSAYFFNPSGAVQARYDKGELLTLVESPLFNNNGSLILPFLSGSGLIVQEGERQNAIQTPWGKAGVLLCNESAVPDQVSRFASDQISFLINLGNDGWFSDFFITKQHFFNGRLRAIEARKDLVINNNRGISGVIRANGDIGSQFQSDASSVQQITIYPNQIPALNYHYFLYFIFSATIVLLLIRLFNSSRVVLALAQHTNNS